MIARHPDADRPLLALLDEIEARAGNDQAVKFLQAQRGREEKETVRKGPKPKGDSLSDKESLSQGTGSAYLLRRLARMDGDWLARYEAGEFPSVRAAAIAAGIVKVPSVKVAAVLRKVGRPKAGEGNDSNRSISAGAGPAYLAARLRRDHPDAEIVHDGRDVSATPAAKPTVRSRPGALEGIAPPPGEPTQRGREFQRPIAEAAEKKSPGRPKKGGGNAPTFSKPRDESKRTSAVAAAAGPATVAELLRRYAVRRRLSARTVRLYGFTIDHFSRFLDHEPTVDDLDDEIVSAFLLWRANQPCRGGKIAAASVEKDRVQILAVWRYGARKRLVAEFPDVAAWRVPKRVKPAYTVDDMERLIAAARALRGDDRTTGGMPRAWWFATLLLAAFQTGERKGGLLGLRWRDVDLDRCLVTFRAENRKGGREDLVRGITPALAAELRHHQGDADAPVWPWCGNPTGLYAPLQSLCRRAGVAYHALHGIRRTSASYVARGGGDATAHLGHSSPTVTRDHYLVGEIVQARAGLEFLPRIGEPSKQQ